jgi:hypothetical protein
VAATVDRAGHPYPLPSPGEPLRLAFLGRPSFAVHALHGPAGVLRPTFVNAAADPLALLAEVRAAAPHVVVVFEPERMPAGLFAGLRAAIVAIVANSGSCPGAGDRPDCGPVPGAVAAVDAASFDRIVTTDAGVADLLEPTVPVWRSIPPPVDDRLYAPVRPASRPPRALFIGRSTAHREEILIAAKHRFDVLHYAHGLWGERLAQALAVADIGINVHADQRTAFERRVSLHLAAGHLLLSERLAPLRGLEPDLDFVEFTGGGGLVVILEHVRCRPEVYERVRLSGRAKAEDFRASRVYSRLVADLVVDLATFGTARRTA